MMVLPVVPLLSLFCCLLVTGTMGREKERPAIVLVPGLCGSVLEVELDHAKRSPHLYCEAESDGYKLAWVDIGSLVPGQKDCLLAHLTPTFDVESYGNARGVKIMSHYDPRGVGAIEYLDPKIKKEVSAYFADMINFLEALGYERGLDLFGAGYDWRMAPDAHVSDFYPYLKTLIEDTGKKTVLIAHSLGGPTTLDFLTNYVDSEWLAAHVESFVSLAAPFGGSARLMKAYVSGDNFDYSFIPMDYLKPVEQAAPSGVYLLPDAETFGENLVILRTPSHNYTVRDAPKLFDDLGLNQAQRILKALLDKNLTLASLRAPPITTYVLSSFGVRTPLTFTYASDFEPGFDDIPQSTTYADGDGVVNIDSLTHVEQAWQQNNKVTFQHFDTIEHFNMVKDQRIFDFLQSTVLKRQQIPGGQIPTPVISVKHK